MLRILMAAVLVAAPMMGAFGVATAGAWVKGTSWSLTDHDQPANQSAIDGNVVVWRDGRNGTCSDWDLYMCNLSTGVETPVSTADGKQMWPSISGDNIVYHSDQNGDWDVYCYNVKTGMTSQVTTDSADQMQADIDGDVIVYRDRRRDVDCDDWDIYMYNLKTGVESEVSAEDAKQMWPAVEGDIIVWEDDRNGDNDVYMYNIGTGVESAVCTATGYQDSVDIDNGVIVWEDDRGDNSAIFMYNLATGVESTLVAGDDASYYDPEIDGDFVVCENDDDDVVLVNIKTGATSIIDPTDECEGMPDISGNMVSFNRYNDDKGYPDIWVYTLANVATAYTPVQGANRYDTAVQNCMGCFADGADTVIIATGENWPDALGASALAGVFDAPILLSYPDVLPLSVRAEIVRLGASNAFVIGGTDAISTGVENTLKNILEGDVTRIGGMHRFETADLVAAAVVEEQGEDYDGTAFLATGGNFPDALAAAPLAAKAGWPIYLSTTDGIAPKTQESMDEAGVTRLLTLGGLGVVPAGVSAQVDAQVERISGANRYATAAAVATWGVEKLGLSWNNVALATGENYPDALAAGASQGRRNSVMLLSTSAYLHPSTAAALITNRSKIGAVIYVGGPSAVSATVRADVAQLLP